MQLNIPLLFDRFFRVGATVEIWKISGPFWKFEGFYSFFVTVYTLLQCQRTVWSFSGKYVEISCALNAWNWVCYSVSDVCHIMYDVSTRLFFTARRYASAVFAVIVCLSVCPSVRPSVRLSVTSRSCTKMAKHIRLTTPYDSPETLFFPCQRSWRNFHDITPNGGAK